MHTSYSTGAMSAPGGADTSKTLSYGGYHQAAAVLSTFEDGSLQPAMSAPPEGLDDLLFDSIPTTNAGSANRWVLAPSVRQDVLRQLGSREALQHALEANPTRPDDPVQQMLEAYIQQRAPQLEAQD